MSISFDQSKDEIAKLCHYFEVNRKSFLASGIKEAHVRQSLIDPFFETLGWDVRNSSRIAPQYREVVPEDSLDVEGHQKAPDYTFRVGTLPKFYAEAKKCGINISADPGPAYQLRRYAFSAKLALSILTDFEELGVYECSSRPRPSDKSSHSRIQYFHFEEYPDKWREIWDIFSREAVWSGSFDQYITSKRKRGTSEVDTEFLKDIEQWRESLARNIALRNILLGVDDLNAAVQRTIDRIIFLRMAEDRGLEPYAQILKLCEQPDIYRRFISNLCRKADERYNSGLFHFQKEPGIVDVPDTITPRLIIDDKTLKPIIQSLYFEFGSPYHFGVLPVEILGTVYERFLGKVIRLTAGHQAKVEEKPEVRKAGGVYYTPSYIVDFIVKNTVGKQVEGKSPAQIAKGKDGQPIRILDMACGSGSFLLGTYQYLLDHCTKWYEANEPEKHSKAVFQDAKGTWRLMITERKRILTTHIFGVDIDHQAVEVTKLSLLLKALEGENDASLTQQMQLFQERALPNLSNNIKCGNSLIGPDYFTGKLFPDEEELRRINPFDWRSEFPEAIGAGGFDCVIGNPPYSAKQSLETKLLANFFTSIEYKCDPYAFFVEQGLRKLNSNGMLGYIIPVTWMTNFYYQKLRELLIVKSRSLHRVVLIDGLVFIGANVDTCLIFLSNHGNLQNGFEWSRTTPYNINAPTVMRSYESILSEERLAIAPDADAAWAQIKAKADNLSCRLDSLAKISLGMKLRTNDEFISRERNDSHPDPICFGDDISRYAPIIPSRFFHFQEAIIIGGTKRPEIHRAKPKIFIQAIRNLSLKRRIVATLDPKGICFVGTVNGVTLLKDEVDILYLLGLINSNFLNVYFRKRFTTISLTAAFLGALPIPQIDKTIITDKAHHDHMMALVGQMLDLQQRYKRITGELEKQQTQRSIEEINKQIDILVYELYNLTPEEIEIVEADSK